MPPPATTGAQPVVAWAAPAAGPEPPASSLYGPGGPAFTVGALLSDSFARYGADPVRLFLVALVPSVISVVTTYASVASVTAGDFSVASTLAWTLLSVVAGVAGTGILFSLIEGGRSAPIGTVVAHGLRRSGWLFATIVALGLIVTLALLAMIVPTSLFLQAWPAVAGLAGLIAILIAVWLVLRLYLAIVGTVVDDLSPSQAIGLSWRISRPAGVWLRMLAALLVLGLAVGPASIAGGLITGAGGVAPVPAVAAAVAVLAFVTPFSALGLYSAYRRLVAPRPRAQVLGAPIGSSWGEEPYVPRRAEGLDPTVDAAPPPPVEAPAPDVPAPEPPQRAAAPEFRVPPLGRAAKGVLALTIVLSAIGLVAVPFALGQLVPSQIPGVTVPTLPGAVAPGRVVFGRSADLRTCTVAGQRTVIDQSESVVWMGAFEQPITLGDEVRIRITLDGDVIFDELQESGFYACLGTDVPESDLPPGRYLFEFLVNGQVQARGALTVT